MFNINRTLKKGVRYPDKELLCDYQDLHFADLVSTPAVRAMSGIDNTIELGDSGYWYMITFDLSLIGQSRKENLMEPTISVFFFDKSEVIDFLNPIQALSVLFRF